VATPRQIRGRGRWSLILGTLLAALTLGAVLAYADTINADTDALATSPPNGNGFTGTQTVGTSHSYDWSVTVNNNGNGADDVFASGSTVSFTVTCSGPSDWTISCTNTSFSQSDYGQNNAGTVTANIPANTSSTGLQSVLVDIHAVSSNGENLSPNEGNLSGLNGRVVLHYNITTAAASNSAPIIDSLGTFGGNEGSDVNLTATAHDPDGDPLTYSWAVGTTGGDSGISCPITDADNTNAAASVNCNDDSDDATGGTFKLTLSVSDDHGHTTSQDTTLDVNNAAPSFNTGKPAFVSANVTCANRSVTLDFAYSDPGSNDTQTASIDWGDGNTSNLTAAQTATGSASHQYNSGGPYTATVNITDDDNGSTGNRTSTNTLIVQYNLSSILQPVNDTGHGQNPSVFKYGSTIPVKVEVTDCNGAHPSNLALFVRWSKYSNQTPPGDYEVLPTSQAELGNQMRFSDPLYVLQLNSKATTTDPSSGLTLFVVIPATNQSTQANIGFK
jgi:hypothetical protein